MGGEGVDDAPPRPAVAHLPSGPHPPACADTPSPKPHQCQHTKPPIKPPDETAHQHLHTGTYFGECIGLSRRAYSPATVGLLLLPDLTLILVLLLPLLLLGAETNCDRGFIIFP